MRNLTRFFAPAGTPAIRVTSNPASRKKKNTHFFVVKWVKNSRVTKQGVFSDEFFKIFFYRYIFFKCPPNYKSSNALNMKESLTCLEPK